MYIILGMKIDMEEGLFISGYGLGLLSGPKAARSEYANLVQGVPDSGFESLGIPDPVTAAFQILRYPADLTEEGKAFITRFSVDHGFAGIDWNRNRNPQVVPMTPNIVRLFNEYIPAYLDHCEHEEERNTHAFKIAMEKLGLNWSDAFPGIRLPDDEVSLFLSVPDRFYERVKPHILVPASRIVRVEGLDEILSDISINESR